jgi:hypothetical protein
MHARDVGSASAVRPVVSLVLAMLLATAGAGTPAFGDDAPPPPPAPPLERLFAPLKDRAKDWPAFFRDSDVKAHFRTYYFNRERPDDTNNEAWAFGGWLAVRSGWLLDTFALGGTLYGSAPLYAP